MRGLIVLLGVLLVAGCGGDDERGAPDAPEGRAEATVDASLPAGTIEVRGTPEVGETVRVAVAADLADVAISWGWHRCAQAAPACLTVAGAEGPRYELTVADAWHTLRVIGVIDDGAGSSRALEARLGPVVNLDPVAVDESMELPAGSGYAIVVAPGPARLTLDATCPVSVVAGVRTLDADADSELTGEARSETAAMHHELEVDGDGGMLSVAVAGGCAAELRVQATR